MPINVIDSESNLISIFCSSNKVLLYGAGDFAKHVLNIFRKYGVNSTDSIEFIISPNKVKENDFNGYKIQYSDNTQIDRNLPVIVSVSKPFTIEILKFLIQEKYKHIYIFHEKFQDKFFKKKNPYEIGTMLKFQVHLVDHCNLNCKYCEHFSPLAKPSFLDIDEYERDLCRLSELFDSAMEYIYLLGGEPLLHPEIEQIFALTRKYFKYGEIRIITNGILLPQMKQSFWKHCHDYNITVSPTPYPLNIDYESIKKEASAAKVNFEFFPAGGGGKNEQVASTYCSSISYA